MNNCQQIYVLRVSCLKLEINEFRCYEAKIQIDPTINELIYTSKLMLHKMNLVWITMHVVEVQNFYSEQYLHGSYAKFKSVCCIGVTQRL